MKQPSPDNVILGLLAARPCHGYQLLDDFHDPDGLGRVWLMSTSQLYVVLKRLQERGHINGHAVESPDAPTRTEYHLTETGRETLMRWLHDRQPSASIRSIRVEFLSRLTIAHLLDVPPGPIIAAQKSVCQRQITLLKAQRDDTPPGTGLLALDFMITQLEGVLQWLDRCDLSMLDSHSEEPS